MAESLFEQLAAIEHQRWSDWQKYMHSMGSRASNGDLVIPGALADQWARQMNTAYELLTDREQESDRDQVRRYWDLIQGLEAVPNG